MPFELSNHSIVIAGAGHNPALVDAYFVGEKNIVPLEWGWQLAAPDKRSPGETTIQYTNGVAIGVNVNVLVVSDASGSDPALSKAADIAKRYISALRHIRCSAVGINFSVVWASVDPVAHLKSRFLKRGSWDTPARSLRGLALTLEYAMDAGKLTISLNNALAAKNNEEAKPVLLIGANFHRVCSEGPTDDQAKNHIGNVSVDWNTFQRIGKDLVGTDE